MPTDSAVHHPSPTALVSRLLNGRYDLLEVIAEGTLFATFRARDNREERDVIVKTLLPRHADNAEVAAAIRAGVGDVLALAHVGIARPFDVGADDAQGVPCFLAEEYAAGLDLQERIRRNAPLASSVAVEVLLSLADALEYAATRGVRHGDVRPAHVLTGPETPIKLTGWGVSEAQSLAAGENPALFLPSAPYTAPEVWATGTPSIAGDLYALGVILFEMLTGALPFAADGDALAVARRHADETVPSPIVPEGTTPRALGGVTRKLLAKRPSDRYASFADLANDLRTIRDALRLGRSLDWSPLDNVPRPAPTIGDSIRATFDEAGTAVMPVPGKVVGGKWVVGGREPGTEPKLAAEVVVPSPTNEPLTTAHLPTTTEFIDPEEDELMAAAVPAHKQRKGFSFSWLLPLNLFLATVFVATCGYVVNLMFLALEPPTDVIVPNLVGKSLTEAKSLAVESKFLVEIVSEEFNDKYPEDSIYQMRPEAGRHIRENKKVTVWVSRGPRMVTVPDVFDVSFDKARQVIEKEGLRIGEKKYEWDVMTAKGNIVQQIPPEGENRARGTRIDLIISKGPEPIEQPQGPVPGDGPDPDEPAPDTTEVTEKDKESSLTLQYDVPNDGKIHIIRIDVTDSRGTITLITESHNAGDKVPLDVTGYGNKITFRVYDNDLLQQKITGPPWSGSGEKTP